MNRSTLAGPIANQSHYAYHRWVSWPEIHTEASAWLSRVDILDSDTETGIIDAGVQVMRGWCERRKAERLGYSVDDLEWYTVKQVKALLLESFANSDGTRPNLGRCDVERAMKDLAPEHRGTIYLYHAGMMSESKYDESVTELRCLLGGARPKTNGARRP